MGINNVNQTNKKKTLCGKKLSGVVLVARAMDLRSLWNEDPEELLLDLGFGADGADLSGRIPARFINYQSQARGMSLQLFLEAQKSRLNLENPDVSSKCVINTCIQG